MPCYTFSYVGNVRSAGRFLHEEWFNNDAAARQGAILTASGLMKGYLFGADSRWRKGSIVVAEGDREVARVLIDPPDVPSPPIGTDGLNRV